jgi:hypothetical protein
MIIQEGKVLDYGHQVSLLLNLHWDEVAKNKALMQLRPDWHKYQTIEANGKLRTLYALEGDTVVGYSCNILDYHLHYSGLKVCSNDVLFVTPAARGSVGIRLIQETERIAKRDGAELMLWHAKEGSVLDMLLSRKGYPVQDIIRSKVL